MVRYLPILLGACLAIVSGLIGAAGVCALAHHEKVSAAPVAMTLSQFITTQPEDTYHYKLTNFQAGAGVCPDPIKPNGEWEKVYVCLFSRETQRLGKNYTSVIAEIEGVSCLEDLTELLKSGELKAYYWPAKQSLPQSAYDRMATKYRGMNFKKCLHVKSGGPTPTPNFGNNCIYVGIGGVSLSVISVILFYLLKLARETRLRSRDPWYDEDKEQISNRAGLPTV